MSIEHKLQGMLGPEGSEMLRPPRPVGWPEHDQSNPVSRTLPCSGTSRRAAGTSVSNVVVI
jgi:hypothetical protein